jgi:hypothetical protein
VIGYAVYECNAYAKRKFFGWPRRQLSEAHESSALTSGRRPVLRSPIKSFTLANVIFRFGFSRRREISRFSKWFAVRLISANLELMNVNRHRILQNPGNLQGFMCFPLASSMPKGMMAKILFQ